MWHAKIVHPHGGEEKYESNRVTLLDALIGIIEEAGIEEDDDRQVTIELHFEED